MGSISAKESSNGFDDAAPAETGPESTMPSASDKELTADAPMDGAVGAREEDNEQKLVPTVFRWEHGGHDVYLSGTFNDWSKKIPMHRSGNDFTYILNLPRERHAFKFIVDDEWRFSPMLPLVRDAAGNVNNVIDLRNFHPQDDVPLKRSDTVAEHLDYSREMPPLADYTMEPPQLPPHLRHIVLNTPAHPSDATLLPTPQHVSLNHLFCTAIRDGVMVQGVSQRYRHKFVTTVFYSLMPLPTREEEAANASTTDGAESAVDESTTASHASAPTPDSTAAESSVGDTSAR